MGPIRRSNRARQPRDYWDPTNSLPHRRQPPAFIIYTEPSEDLDSELSDKDLDFELFNKDLDSELFKKNLSPELDKDLSLKLDEDLSEHLSRQLHEGLGVDPLYQPQFLSKDRAGKPQNLSEDSDSLKLFQLFFPVKEIENIVKQINQ